MKKSKCCR